MVDVKDLENRVFGVFCHDLTFRGFMQDLINEQATPYLSGGFVRDSILGIKPKDYDVILDKNIDNERLAGLAGRYGSVLIKPYFGIRMNYSAKEIDLWRFADYQFRGSAIQNINEAILDFDLNINALAYDVKNNHLIDPQQIAQHLSQVEISVLDACYQQPLSENKIVVVLRAVKLSYKTGLKLSENAHEFIQTHLPYLSRLKWQARDALGDYIFDEKFVNVLEQTIGKENSDFMIKTATENVLR